VEENDGTLFSPNIDHRLKAGDIVWVVGENEAVHALLDEKVESADRKSREEE
jgi:K+/H+ antiporter YhaU regulatory subunit KhtT